MEQKEKTNNMGANADAPVQYCPLCTSHLTEQPMKPAILFVCNDCGFKLLTTHELFPNCFVQNPAPAPILNPKLVCESI